MSALYKLWSNSGLKKLKLKTDQQALPVSILAQSVLLDQFKRSILLLKVNHWIDLYALMVYTQ